MTVTSETKEEAITLFKYALDEGKAPVQRIHKPHKKHVFMKECDVCGFKAKGGTGLSAHKRSKHKVTSYLPPTWHTKTETDTSSVTER